MSNLPNLGSVTPRFRAWNSMLGDDSSSIVASALLENATLQAAATNRIAAAGHLPQLQSAILRQRLQLLGNPLAGGLMPTLPITSHSTTLSLLTQAAANERIAAAISRAQGSPSPSRLVPPRLTMTDGVTTKMGNSAPTADRCHPTSGNTKKEAGPNEVVSPPRTCAGNNQSDSEHHTTSVPTASSGSSTSFVRFFPCRARGVRGSSQPHSESTAVLKIPSDAAHGMVIACSNTECAASGRRFRWCSVCQQPVAKRNFMKRHCHGIITSARYTMGDYLHDKQKQAAAAAVTSTNKKQHVAMPGERRKFPQAIRKARGIGGSPDQLNQQLLLANHANAAFNRNRAAQR